MGPEDLLRGAMTGAPPAPNGTPEPAAEPVVGPECEIAVEYRLGSGQVLQGVFRFRVPTVAERRTIAWREAKARGGLAPDTFAATSVYEQQRDAYLSVTLRESPPWWKDGEDLLDSRIADQLYREALAHEVRFLRAGRDCRSGEGESGKPG